MQKFLLVSTRPEDEAAEAEYRSFLRISGLTEEEFEQVRLDLVGLPDIDQTAYAGIIVAGSNYGTTTPSDRKSPTQLRAEEELAHLFRAVKDAQTPCLATGYGMEVACMLAGGTVTRRWAEPPSMVTISLTPEALDDPLMDGFPRSFDTFVNHHEAAEEAPEGAVVLAKSMSCPIQMMRLAPYFYTTQFNPEVDSDAIKARVSAFEDAGYPGTDDTESLLASGREGEGHHQAGKIVTNFIKYFRS